MQHRDPRRTLNTPAMARKLVGLGSQYAYEERDREGRYLDGSSTYRLTLPAGVPAKNFWSLVAYDPQTRSELQTSQPFPSKNSQRDALELGSDGSVDLWFGPAAPSGRERNWIATVPGKGWFAILRLYGPLGPGSSRRGGPGNSIDSTGARGGRHACCPLLDEVVASLTAIEAALAARHPRPDATDPPEDRP